MKRKFTRRDVAFFFLGVFTFILIDTALNWDQAVQGFKDGANAATHNREIQK